MGSWFRLGAPKLVHDRRLEVLGPEPAFDFHAVDEEGRRAADAQLPAERHISAYLLEDARVLRVEISDARYLTHSRSNEVGRHRRLTLEEPGLHRLRAVLRACHADGSGRFARRDVNASSIALGFQRKILGD